MPKGFLKNFYIAKIERQPPDNQNQNQHTLVGVFRRIKISRQWYRQLTRPAPPFRVLIVAPPPEVFLS
jgi:hypothetical protein